MIGAIATPAESNASFNVQNQSVQKMSYPTHFVIQCFPYRIITF